ncbi:MAG: cytochrome c biogenesis protein [Candidatus Omnitrophica bacterium]|nr:cytochrome c biogenesis protein [Candidatus Omnitrophota bacterium]
MYWLTDRHLFLVAVLIYGASVVHSVFLWRQGFRRADHINYGLLLLGFVFHTGAMLLRGFSLNRCPINNLFEATMFIGWTIVTSYLVVGAWPRLRFLGAFASPLLFGLGVFGLMPALDMKELPPQSSQAWFQFHATMIFLAYGAFGLSAVAGLMFVSQEHDLKLHKFRAIFSLLPPIQRLERLISRLLLGGFLLLTAGLIVGTLWLKSVRGIYYQPDPKIHWSLFVWLLYLVLLVLHWKFAQRGRRFAWSAIGAFAFIMLTFWGFNLFSPIHHP